MTNPDEVSLVEKGFVPCPFCKQYGHSIGEDQLAAAFRHFQSMIAHPVRGHPMGDAFDEQTRDAAQVLMASATPLVKMRDALEAADEALREYACHGGPGVPCLRSPEQCRDQCGREAGDALIKVSAALSSNLEGG